MKKNLNKEELLNIITKMVENKETVISYIKEKTHKQSLESKGIKLTKPI
jgi:hypothetical protein